MKSVFGVLCLTLVLVWTQAQEPESCNKALSQQDLHKLDGDWVLVWMVYNRSQNAEENLFPNFTSSHVELRVLPDNKRLSWHERNVYQGGKCVTFTVNISLPDSSEGEQRRLVLAEGTEHKDGELKSYSDSATLEFLPSSENSMKMIYHSKTRSPFLLIYRREGHHRDMEGLKAEHGAHRKLAQCLGFSLDEEWSYDGAADFCHKKSAPEEKTESCNKALSPQDLHKVDGDWVLVWMVYNTSIKPEEHPMPNFTSSHLELRVLPDSKRLSWHERNVYQGGKCAIYKLNAMLPDSSEGEQRRLVMAGATEHKDGELKPFNDSATLEFLPSSENSMKMIYHSKTWGSFFLIYRREGHHRDVEGLKAEHGAHRKLAQCLGFSLDEEWSYDGTADFCHKKSAPEEKTESCNKALSPQDLHKLDGDWVLVWMVYNTSIKPEEHPMPNFTSSHVELRVLPDSKRLSWHERNVYQGSKCAIYKVNLSLPDSSEGEQRRLVMADATEHKDGKVKPFNESATLEFLPSSENSMNMIYDSKTWDPFFLIYRREGHHRDVEGLKAEHGAHRKLAQCLGFSLDEEWSYDGAADFCHKKSAPEEKTKS